MLWTRSARDHHATQSKQRSFQILAAASSTRHSALTVAMATLLISQHSSNPLEAASSDPRNTRYRRVLNEARARQVAAEEDPSPSSEDQISGYAPKDDMHAYWGHLAQVTPVISKVKQKYGRKAAEVTTNLNNNMVDLDDDMDSDDPLALRDEPMEFEEEVEEVSFDEEASEEQEERG